MVDIPMLRIMSVAFPESSLNSLEAIRIQYQLPAVAALSINNDTSIDVQVTGRRNAYVANAPVTTDDVFKLGSNTKAMTSTLLARVIEESTFPRKITWDTTIPVALLFSGVIIHPGHYRTTLAQIAAHLSGIVDGANGIPPQAGRLYDPRLTPAEGRRIAIEAALRDPPATTPGTEFAYSNTGYMLLGFIIETLLKEPWEDLIQRKLFDPLGMESCGFGVGPPLKTPRGIENPWPHAPSRFGPVPNYPGPLADVPLAMGPAGSVYCSMADYAKFIQLHIDGFNGRPNRILRFRGSFDKLHTPYLGQNYTCGAWNRDIVEVDGSEVVQLRHDGSNLLNYATAWVYPELSKAAVAFTNVGGDNAAAGCRAVARCVDEWSIKL